MPRLLAVIGATVGGAIGWWMGDWVGFGTAVFLSVVGTAAGVYASRRLVPDYLQ